MIRSQLRLLCALVVPTLVLTACSGSPADQRPAHPVFDAPVGQQPRQALLETQDSRSARFTQTLTFGSPSGDTVQRSAGRVDFAEGRAAGSIEWSLAPDLPETAKDALLGVRLGPGHAPARTRIAVDRDSVRLRAGEAGYWLTYGGTLEAFGGEASVNALRGSESAFGGTLLEIVSGAQDVKHAEDAEGGRTYEAKLTAYNALRMFSRDLQAELTSNIDPSGTDTPVTLGLAVDADGHIARAEADFTELLDRKDSALAEMTGLHAVMTLNKQGDSPPVMPAPSEPILDAKTAVRAVGDLKRGRVLTWRPGTARSTWWSLCPAPSPTTSVCSPMRAWAPNTPATTWLSGRRARHADGTTSRPPASGGVSRPTRTSTGTRGPRRTAGASAAPRRPPATSLPVTR